MGMNGRRTMTGRLTMCSPFKAKSPRRSLISCKPNFPQARRRRSNNRRPRPTLPLSTFTAGPRLFSFTRTQSVSNDQEGRQAVELLDQAVKREPSFFDAYCQLAYAHEWLYAVA